MRHGICEQRERIHLCVVHCSMCMIVNVQTIDWTLKIFDWLESIGTITTGSACGTENAKSIDDSPQKRRVHCTFVALSQERCQGLWQRLTISRFIVIENDLISLSAMWKKWTAMRTRIRFYVARISNMEVCTILQFIGRFFMCNSGCVCRREKDECKSEQKRKTVFNLIQ